MAKLPPTILPFIVSAIMSSTDYGSQFSHLVFGVVVDEKGNNIEGASILVESTVDKKHTLSSTDGTFLTDICIRGSFDEIYIEVNFEHKTGTEKIYAGGNPTEVDIMLH